MPRYFFDIVDGVTLRDREGSEQPDLHAARTQAIVMLAGVLMDKEKPPVWTGDHCSVEVRDEGGRRLFDVRLTVGAAPAWPTGQDEI